MHEKGNAYTLSAIAVAAILLFATTGQYAFGDSIVDDIVATPEKKTVNLGDSFTITYTVIEGGSPGCDASDGGFGVKVKPVFKVGSTTITSISGTEVTITGCGSGFSQTTTVTMDSSAKADVYSVSLAVNDATGDSYTTSAATFQLIVRPPTPTLSSPLDGSTTSDSTPSLTWNAIDSTKVAGTFTYEIEVDDDSGFGSPVALTGTSGILSSVTTYTVSAALPDGTYYWHVRAVGTANNAGPYSTPFSFTVDTTPTPSDTTKPTTTATLDPSSPDGQNGWYVSPVEVTLTAEDNVGGSGVASTTYEIDGGSTETYTAPFTVSDDGEHTVTFRSEDNDGNVEVDQEVIFKIDQTDPTITGGSSPDPNSDGWNNEDVTVTFNCGDATSGVASCEGDTLLTDETDTTGITVTGTATDNAGNTNTHDVGPIKIDKTDPVNIQFTDGGLTDNGEYFFGFVPDGPTQCTADDALSGLDHCSVDSSNGGNSVGNHSYVATAVDNADNEDSKTLSYTVKSWILTGFYQPVDMSPYAPTTIMWNTIKGGQTVPLKFEIFATDEFTSTTFNNAPIGTFATKKVLCGTVAGSDSIEELATTGGTAFRYDATSGQYIQNWKTPSYNSNGQNCYLASFTAQDGSTLSAYFLLKK